MAVRARTDKKSVEPPDAVVLARFFFGWLPWLGIAVLWRQVSVRYRLDPGVECVGLVVVLWAFSKGVMLIDVANARRAQAEREWRAAHDLPPQDFVPDQLAQYDGTREQMPICLAVRGEVFNVSLGQAFYGAGGDYHVLAGTDATWRLGKRRLEHDVMQDDHPLTAEENDEVDGWLRLFRSKYPRLGRLLTHSEGGVPDAAAAGAPAAHTVEDAGPRGGSAARGPDMRCPAAAPDHATPGWESQVDVAGHIRARGNNVGGRAAAGPRSSALHALHLQFHLASAVARLRRHLAGPGTILGRCAGSGGAADAHGHSSGALASWTADAGEARATHNINKAQ